EIDSAARLQCADAGDRDGDRKRPHPHPTPVAEVRDVGDGAHRAEIRVLADGPEHDAERKRSAGDDGGQGVRRGHPEIIPCTPGWPESAKWRRPDLQPQPRGGPGSVQWAREAVAKCLDL